MQRRKKPDPDPLPNVSLDQLKQEHFNTLSHTLVRGLHQISHEMVLNRDFIIIEGLPVLTKAGVIRTLNEIGPQLRTAIARAVSAELDARAKAASEPDDPSDDGDFDEDDYNPERLGDHLL